MPLRFSDELPAAIHVSSALSLEIITRRQRRRDRARDRARKRFLMEQSDALEIMKAGSNVA